MKATGIVRQLDDLGRIVIPKEIRKQIGVQAGDPLEIFVERDGMVCLKRYEPIGEYEWEKAKNMLGYILEGEYILLDRYGAPKAGRCEVPIVIGGTDGFNRNIEIRIDGDVEGYLAIKHTEENPNPNSDEQLAVAGKIITELFNNEI